MWISCCVVCGLKNERAVQAFVVIGVATVVVAVALLFMLLYSGAQKYYSVQPVIVEQQPITFSLENPDKPVLTSMLVQRNYTTDSYKQQLLFGE
jgi:hypothetical protein